MTVDAPWVTVRATPSRADAAVRDAVSAALFAAGAEGVHEDGADLVTHMPPDTDTAAVEGAVRRADPHASLQIAPMVPSAWEQYVHGDARAQVTAHEVGALVIAPTWLADTVPMERAVIIEPGMAFGTGEHPTTRGVMRLLSALPLQGATVADLGAGSAVLSIAAAKLGAACVYAIENDGDAIANAEENVARNGVSDCVHVFHGEAGSLLPLIAPVQVITANIISSVLKTLLPAMAVALAPGGIIILSGILMEEQLDMRGALARHGWTEVADDSEGMWWSVAARR